MNSSNLYTIRLVFKVQCLPFCWILKMAKWCNFVRIKAIISWPVNLLKCIISEVSYHFSGIILSNWQFTLINYQWCLTACIINITFFCYNEVSLWTSLHLTFCEVRLNDQICISVASCKINQKTYPPICQFPFALCCNLSHKILISPQPIKMTTNQTKNKIFMQHKLIHQS